MSENLFENRPVPKGYDTAYMVSAVAIAAQNFKCKQLRDSDVSVIAILPYLIAVRVILCTACGTSIVDFGAGGIPDTLPPLIILEEVVDALVKERAGNEFRNQNAARHKIPFLLPHL
jgi:hypothetical protein